MINKFQYFFVFLFILFIFPLHFFIIGEANGYGIQGVFYRYQISSYGISFVPITAEIGYVTSGLINGKSALAILLWVAGTCSLSAAFFLFLLWFYELNSDKIRSISRLIFLSSVVFIFSSFAQYGVFFCGPAGVSVLIGIPVLICFGWMFQNEIKNEAESANYIAGYVFEK